MAFSSVSVVTNSLSLKGYDPGKVPAKFSSIEEWKKQEWQYSKKK